MSKDRAIKKFKGYWETPCDGCTDHNMPYMVTFDLWRQVAKPTDDFLCLHCVEKRAGRSLTKADFLDPDTNPINNGFFGFCWQDWVFRKDKRNG